MSPSTPHSRARWTVLWMVFILFLSSTAGPPVPEMPVPYLDKVAHFLFYGLLGILFLRIDPGSIQHWRQCGLCWLAVALFGAFDEGWQSFRPERMMEFADWVADILGGAVAIILYARWQRFRKILEWDPFSRRKD